MTISIAARRPLRLLAAAATASILLVSALGAADAHADAVQRENFVSKGEFRTLATLWNTTASAQFRCPHGAQIRVRYGIGWFSKNRQQQTLDCNSDKRLSVGSTWSKFGARMQIKVPTSGPVTWWYITEGP
jgi:hypothetical protein